MTTNIDAAFLQTHLDIVRRLRTDSGLFLAAGGPGVSTGYDKAWLRDNFYTSLCFEYTNDNETVLTIWHRILDIFLKHEDKINWAVENKPFYAWQYIHARYNPETFEEYWEEWGNKQNDAVGCILFTLGDLASKGIYTVRDNNDTRVIQRLVDYLATIEYWHDGDNGVWEEYEEVHASSVAACVAGLREISRIPSIEVRPEIILKGEDALEKLLPRESTTKFTDLAQLSIIWPFRACSNQHAHEILKNVEYHLVKDRGVIRYKKDQYYNANQDGWSEEAEWTMGLAWLSIIYSEIGDKQKARYFFERCLGAFDETGKLPELYYSNTSRPNENNPLAWAESLLIVAAVKIES